MTSVQLATLVPVVLISASSTAPVVGSNVTLSGTGTAASAGRTITSYRWSLSSGVGLASFTGATDGSSATLATRGVGQVVVQLTVTDAGRVRRAGGGDAAGQRRRRRHGRRLAGGLGAGRAGAAALAGTTSRVKADA